MRMILLLALVATLPRALPIRDLWSNGDKTALAGSETTMHCFYDKNRFLFGKKYWCAGGSRRTCDVLCDTSGFINTKYATRLSLKDTRVGLFSITFRQLSLEDSGTYWCGIERPYADIMTSMTLDVKEEPVSPPFITFLNAPERTCEGESVTVQCKSVKGFNIKYVWYKKRGPTAVPVSPSTNMNFHCGVLQQTQEYYCEASNRESKKTSHIVTAEVLTPSKDNCIYQLVLNGMGTYSCVLPTKFITTSTTMPTTPVTKTSLNLSKISYFNSECCPSTANTSCLTMALHCHGIRIMHPWDILRWVLLAVLVMSLMAIQRYGRRSRHMVKSHHETSNL
ncbi:polymeric immunoglobulin receptor-like [Lissotriton helveticus]